MSQVISNLIATIVMSLIFGTLAVYVAVGAFARSDWFLAIVALGIFICLIAALNKMWRGE